MYLNALGNQMAESAVGTFRWPGRTADRLIPGTPDNDSLTSYAGSTLVGGDGDDTYYVWDTGSTVVEQARQGIDTVIAQFWGTATLSANVENLYLASPGATAGIGNTLDNLIVAGAVGATLDGGAGSDVLVGGTGADVFRIAKGNGSDAIVNFRGGWDVVELKGYGFTSFNMLKAAASQVGADVQINLGGSEKLMVRDVRLDALTAADFGFSAVGTTVAGASVLSGGGKAYTARGVTVLNNAWGAGNLIEGVDYKLDSSYHSNNQTAGTTFNWAFPNTTDLWGGIKAYPMIGFGVSPFGDTINATDTAHTFPIKLTDLSRMTVTFSTAISGNIAGFNVSYDIWLTSKPNGDASTITNEIMIWTHRGEVTPGGDLVGTFKDGAITGKIYHTGTYTAVVLDTDLMVGTLDVTAVLQALQKLGIVSVNEYLAAVQFGSEVKSGVGTLSINQFDLRTEIADGAGGTSVRILNGEGTHFQTAQPDPVPAAVDPYSYQVGTNGNNTFTIKTALQHVKEAMNGGVDSIVSYVDYTLDANVENLALKTGAIKAIGNDLANKITGNEAGNVVDGMAGDDKVYGMDGNDTLQGGAGNDWVEGGAGDDMLTGGTGADTLYGCGGRDSFRFTSGDSLATKISAEDRIVDFTSGDSIYVDGSMIDFSRMASTSINTSKYADAYMAASTLIIREKDFVVVNGNKDSFVFWDADHNGVIDNGFTMTNAAAARIGWMAAPVNAELTVL